MINKILFICRRCTQKNIFFTTGNKNFFRIVIFIHQTFCLLVLNKLTVLLWFTALKNTIWNLAWIATISPYSTITRNTNIQSLYMLETLVKLLTKWLLLDYAFLLVEYTSLEDICGVFKYFWMRYHAFAATVIPNRAPSRNYLRGYDLE